MLSTQDVLNVLLIVHMLFVLVLSGGIITLVWFVLTKSKKDSNDLSDYYSGYYYQYPRRVDSLGKV